MTVAVPLAAAVADTPIADPVPPAQGQVGTLAGEPSVDGGAANYRIAVEVPPGRGGLQPEVSLTYSSRSGNGVAGVGWSLNAAPSIYRCPRTLEQDEGDRPVMMDDQDRLCVAGQRLVLTSGAFGQTGSTYVTEINPFDRYTLQGALSSGSSSFLVEKKSGRRQVFAQLASAPDVWRLTVELDRNATPNCVSYAYVNLAPASRGPDAREWHLQSILYTGRFTGAPLDGTCVPDGTARSVNFLFELRPDPRTTYRAGVASMSTQRLVAIETKVGSALVRRYELTYSTSPATGRSLLASATVCNTTPCGGFWASLDDLLVPGKRASVVLPRELLDLSGGGL